MKNNELLTTITYDLIMSMKPCYDPAEIGITADYSASVIDFIKDYRCKVKNLQDIQWVIKRSLSGKESAIYALFCSNQVRHLMKDERSITALDITEKYLNGNATIEALREAKNAAYAAYAAAASAYADAAAAASAYDAAYVVASAYASAYAAYAAAASAYADADAAASAYAAYAAYASAYAAYAAAAASAYDAAYVVASAYAKNKMLNIQIDKLIEILEERE